MVSLLEITILTNLPEAVPSLADHLTKATEATLLVLLTTNLLGLLADHLTKVVEVAQEVAEVVVLVLPEEVEGINTSTKKSIEKYSDKDIKSGRESYPDHFFFNQKT